MACSSLCLSIRVAWYVMRESYVSGVTFYCTQVKLRQQREMIGGDIHRLDVVDDAAGTQGRGHDRIGQDVIVARRAVAGPPREAVFSLSCMQPPEAVDVAGAQQAGNRQGEDHVELQRH